MDIVTDELPAGSLFDQIRARVRKTLKNGVQLDMSTQESRKLLRRHVNSKTNFVFLFVDINNSTQMSLSMQEDRFALLIQVFAQEISVVVSGYGGYVFKYVGDAVIVLFPAGHDPSKACVNAMSCSKTILDIIQNIMSPIFEEMSLPDIKVRIGIDYGEVLVVVYGKDVQKAHIDILGSAINIASKIASITQANQILVGESVYNILGQSKNERIYLNNVVPLREITLDTAKWNYPSYLNVGSVYRVYEYTC
jgi:adenylate cyclase